MTAVEIWYFQHVWTFWILIAAPKTNLNNYAKQINCLEFFFLTVLAHEIKPNKKSTRKVSILITRCFTWSSEKQNTMPNSHQAPTKHVDREQTKRNESLQKLSSRSKRNNKFSINQQITILGNYHIGYNNSSLPANKKTFSNPFSSFTKKFFTYHRSLRDST